MSSYVNVLTTIENCDSMYVNMETNRVVSLHVKMGTAITVDGHLEYGHSMLTWNYDHVPITHQSSHSADSMPKECIIHDATIWYLFDLIT